MSVEYPQSSQVYVNHTIWNRGFIILTLSNMLFFMLFEMFLPVLPLYVVSLGANSTQMGLVMGIFMFSAIFVRMFTSLMAQKINKKYLLIIGVSLCMIMSGSYFWASGIFMILLVRLIHGFGFGIASTFYNTIAADQIPPDRIGEGMSYFGVGEMIAISIAPLLGVLLLNISGFKNFFNTSAFIMLLVLIMVLFIPKKPLSSVLVQQLPNNDNGNQNRFKFQLFEKQVLFQSLLGLLSGIVAGGIMSFSALYAIEQGFSNIAWFFFTIAIANVLVRLVTGKLFDKKGPGFVLIPASVSCIIALIILTCARTEVHFIFAAFFYGIGYGCIFPNLMAWCVTLVGAERSESAIASFLNSFDMGVASGSLILGIIAGAMLYKTMYLISILAYVLFISLYFGRKVFNTTKDTMGREHPDLS